MYLIDGCKIKVFNSDNFFQSLGMARTAEVKRDALIGKATAQMETMIRQSLAAEQLTKSKLDNDTQVRIWDSQF